MKTKTKPAGKGPAPQLDLEAPSPETPAEGELKSFRRSEAAIGRRSLFRDKSAEEIAAG